MLCTVGHLAVSTSQQGDQQKRKRRSQPAERSDRRMSRPRSVCSPEEM